MIKSLKIRGVLMFVCVLSVFQGTAQQNYAQHNWYFGNSVRGIRFNRTDNTASLVTNQATPFGTGGAAVASDPANANILFYTDGENVFNIAHTQMSNGNSLNGNINANQPVAIGKVPGQPNQYLIFTNSASFTTPGTISVSTVDMSLPGGEPFPTPPLGNVTTRNIATGLTGRSEAMITVPHFNGIDFWLITHENGTDNYTATLVAAGPVLTHNTFSGVTGLPISAANFSYHEATGKIAVAPQTTDDNVVILNFDNATGAITLDQFVFNSRVNSTTSQAIYDTEWSNSGRFLYISQHGEAGIPANVIQFDLNNPGTTLASVLPASLAITRSYGLQMAPDSSIYHLYETTAGIFRAGILTNTDTVASGVLYTPDFFGASADFDGRQFPSFVPRTTNVLTVSFVKDGSCSNSPVAFYPLVTPGADSLVWNFGDGQSSNEWSPIHTYQAGGNFNVEVIAFLNGDTASFEQVIPITQFDLQLSLVQDTTACRCEFPPPVGSSCPPGPFNVTVDIQGGTPSSVIWSNGDSGPTLTPDSAGYYYVVVTDVTGCIAYAGVNVREYDAQDQRANIWYFGQNAGINFNTPPGITPISGPINTQEGVSVISDRNGEVILSTDGVNVYDRNDLLVATNIGGQQGATQSALIMPVPGDETLFYIFTTQEVHGTNTYELRYSLYDIKLNSGDGGLLETNKLLFTRSTERITGNGGWLIAHEYGNNSFRAYPVTQTGIGNPVISSIGSDHLITDAYNGQGYMKMGGNMLVVALPSFNVSNVLEFFDFNNTTGEITNFRSVDLSATTHQVYGVEFAGNKIFATLRGASSEIREMYIDFQGNPVLIPPITPGPASGPFSEELGAIQLGPDGQVYVAANNRAYLGTISVNGDTTLLSNFTPNGFALAGGTTSRLGLPNFIQSVGTGPSPASMTISAFCEGSPTIFAATGTDPIDEFLWSFGDGFSSDSASVEHTYPITGVPTDYIVTLQVTNRCGLDTLLTQTITIFPPPAAPTFLPPGIPQAVLCNGPLTLEAEPAPGTAGYTYLWSNGDTTRTSVISRQSNVGVTITSAQGCPTSGSIIVADNRPQLELGPDRTLCQNTPVAPLNAQNPGAQYQWFVDNIANGNIGQTQTVTTATAGPPPVAYSVEVRDPITTCTIRDTIVFTINASPNFTAVPTNTTTCGVNNGQIALTLNSPAGTEFTYSVTGITSGTSIQDIDQPTGPVLPVFGSLPADTYVINVEDQVSGCVTTSSVGINSTVVTITSVVAHTPTCNPIAIDVQTTGITNFTGATYVITNSGTGAQVATGPVPAANFTTLPVPVPGTYTIQVNAIVQNCVATFNFNVVSDPMTPVSFVPDLCNGQITAQPAGAVSYTWSTIPAGGVSGAGPTVTIAQGTWDVTVVVNDGTNCPGTGTTTVTVEPPITANFTQSDECQNTVTLSATPAGPYTYRWFDGATPILGGSSIVIGLSENGDTYRVEVVSTVTGCSDDFSAIVNVVGLLTVSLNAINPAPCEGSPFVLTANSNNPAATFQWFRNDVVIPGETNSTLPNLTQGGEYRVTALLLTCSAESNEETVTLRADAPGTLPTRALICPDDANPNPDTRQVELTAALGTDYQWYQNDVAITNTTRTHIAVEEAIYRVEFLSLEGCPSEDETDVDEECSPRIVAPTAFRPGSSIAANSTFYVLTYFVESEDFQLFIYNRWGELIYQSNGLSEGGNQSKSWNGGYNNSGQALPAGTYSYVVRYKSSYKPEDGVQEKRGGVVLLR